MLTAAVEIKTTGIMRLTRDDLLVRDLPIAVMPADLARALNEDRDPAAPAILNGSGGDYEQQGLNSAYYKWHQAGLDAGIFTSQAEAERFWLGGNAALDHPMPEERVLKAVRDWRDP